MAQVATESHGNPFFLQMWGKLLWQACSQVDRPVGHLDLGRARPLFKKRRNLYYLTRHTELKRAELPSVAADISALFASAERVPPDLVPEVVGSSLGLAGKAADREAVLKAQQQLQDLGYIWSIDLDGSPCYEPGIPMSDALCRARSRFGVWAA